MRIAVIADIHGNCLALDAALADIRCRDVQQIVCLGDAIQGGAQPAETVQRLQSLNCPVVMGNADAWLLTGKNTSPVEQVSEQQLAVRTWSLAQLSSAEQAWIESFQPTIELPLEGGKKLLCFHGSPHSFDDIILPDTPEEEFRRMLQGFDAALLTGGHTHTQQLRRLDDAWFFNPGSVGFAYNRMLPAEEFHADPWADYAIVNSENTVTSVEFYHVPIDIVKFISVLQASGKPDAERTIKMYQHAL